MPKIRKLSNHYSSFLVAFMRLLNMICIHVLLQGLLSLAGEAARLTREPPLILVDLLDVRL